MSASLTPRRNEPVVAIVGAGMGGISAGVLLRRAGIGSFTIYESAERVGGTWWHNRYPGAEVDVDSYVYSFPFARHDWSRTHARQPELHAYLEGVVTDHGLIPHLRLGTGVTRAVWDDDLAGYHLTLSSGETAFCNVLISGVGFLNVPNLPDWPGLADFTGPCFHTARWEPQHDLTGKRVAVVGTGSTASQVVPALQPLVGEVVVFQREPGWVIPKGDRDYTAEERRKLRSPLVHLVRRAKWYWATEKRLWGGATYRPGSPVNQMAERAGRAYLAKVFADRPDLAEACTPSYPFWGKRPIYSSDYYPALTQPNVTLVPKAVRSVTARGVVDADGTEHPVDVLVLATGFQPVNYLAHLAVVGRDGRTLHDHWAGEPRAFLGMTVPGFPNFFMLYGPGTNLAHGGSLIFQSECQVRYVMDALRRTLTGGHRVIEVRPEPAAEYRERYRNEIAQMVWAHPSVTHTHFKNSRGEIWTASPWPVPTYWAWTRSVDPTDFTVA